jgi:NADH-quinone oxidoreductase subunit N
MAAAADLILLFLAIEFVSLVSYVLAGSLKGDRKSSEAGVKYFFFGAAASAIMLYGFSYLYGVGGSTNLYQLGHRVAGMPTPFVVVAAVLILAGLGFKTSLAPFHQWTPDVYEGAPTPVTAFMSAATKTAALVVALRLLVTAFPGDADVWTVALAVIAVCSLVIGNFAALVQRGVKRMLAYSSISHAGFMLIPLATNSSLGARALLFYLIPYSAMSLGAFAVVAARERELGVPVTFENMAGFGWERPLLGISMWAFMLGFAGFPLTGGFIGKFYAFAAAYDHGWTWLVIVGVLATLVSLYYYLGLVRAMYMRRTEDLQLAPIGGSPPRDALLQTAVLTCLVVTVGSFFAVQPLIDLAKHAANSLPF